MEPLDTLVEGELDEGYARYLLPDNIKNSEKEEEEEAFLSDLVKKGKTVLRGFEHGIGERVTIGSEAWKLARRYVFMNSRYVPSCLYPLKVFYEY
jgi:hypothetical protein